jgi:zinc transporter, ZIP family
MIAAFLWGALSAISLMIGFLIAERGLSNRIIGLIMAFGAGALISAVAYELVPESAISGWGMAVSFVLGAIAFFAGDWLVDCLGGRHRKTLAGKQHPGSGAVIFVGTLLDNVPESIVLGMSLGLGGGIGVAFLAAVFISNLPEGVAGTVNLAASGHSRRAMFYMWSALVLVSAVSTLVGYGLVQWVPGADGRLVQAFAAGAVLTMLADAMIPEAFEHGGRMAGLLTVLGFGAAGVLSVVA